MPSATLHIRSSGAAFKLRPGESITFVLPVTPRTKKNSRVHDAVGYYQALADALESAGVLSNDKWITQWDGSRLAKDAERSRIEVTLTAI